MCKSLISKKNQVQSIKVGLKMPEGTKLFHTFYLFGVSPVDENYSAHQISALIIALIGIFIFNGLLITAFSSGIERYVERIREGRKRFNMSNHVVMIGYNQYSISVIEQIFSKNKHTRLIILTTKEPLKVRAKLRATLPSSIDNKVIIYAGDGNTSKHVKSLNLDKAIGVYIMVEGNEWENQYTQSMLLLKEVSCNAGNRSINSNNLLPVFLFINESSSFELVKQLNIPPSYVGNIVSDGTPLQQSIDLHIFNFYENWARLLWSYYGKKKDTNYVYDSLDFEPIENTDKYVHLVIVGFNSMGQALLMEAVRLCHYPNFDDKTGQNKSKITIIDPNGDSLRTIWNAQHPNMNEVKDIDIEFLSTNIEDFVSRMKLKEWSNDQRQMLTIAICMADPDLSMSLALSLPEEVFFNYNNLKLIPKDSNQPNGKQLVVENPTRTRILVRQNVKKSLSDIISYNEEKYKHLKLFGTFLDGFDEDLLNDDLSICVNGIYSDYSNILSDEENGEKNLHQISYSSKYDEWAKNWLDFSKTPETHKLATRYQIDYYRSLLPLIERTVSPNGTIPDDILTKLANSEHRRWIAERCLSGWRQIKDGERRIDSLNIHTCITSHTNLPASELVKDRNVIRFARILIYFVNNRIL